MSTSPKGQHNLILLLSDLQRQSYKIVGSYWRKAFEIAGWRVIEIQTPETEEEREAITGKYIGAIIFHNTLGSHMIPLKRCVNIALPGHEWDRYPRNWVHNLNTFDSVWTYSQHVANTLKSSGVTCQVHFQPLPLYFESIPKKSNWPIVKPFNFISCGEAHFRKGFHLLMLGFQEAFPKVGEASLTIKTSQDCQWVSPREDIRIITELMSRKQILSLYHKYDGYVSASLGEGLGLPVAEAVRAGLPVAVNYWGGHCDLLTHDGFFPIDFEVIKQPFCSNPEYYAKEQCCAFSSPENIAKALVSMAKSSLTERKNMVLKAQNHLRSSFSNELVIEKITKKICELL